MSNMDPPLQDTSRPPLNIPLYSLGPYLIIGLAVALRQNIPGLGFRLAVVVGIIAMFVHAVKLTTGDGGQDYGIASGFGSTAFTAIAMLLLSDPIKECRHESHKESMTEMPLWKRVYWGVCIRSNVRGIGWNYQVLCG